MIYTGKDGFFRMGFTLLFMAAIVGATIFIKDKWPDFRLFGKFPLWQCFLFTVGLWLLYDLLKVLLYLCLRIVGFILKLVELKRLDNSLKKVADIIFYSKKERDERQQKI